MDTEGAALTVSVSVVVALSPIESLTAIVRLCVPISLVTGVHEKLPDEFMFPLLTLLPEAESLMVYVGLVKPEAETLNETFVPTEMFVLGESDWIETETLAYANASGTVRRLTPTTKPETDLITVDRRKFIVW
jgi:hypothetical protein